MSPLAGTRVVGVAPSGVNRDLTSGRRSGGHSGDYRPVENDEFARFTRRVLAAHGRRIARGDIEGVADLASLATTVDRALTEAIGGLRRAGYSWADIGRRLGTSRQAAQQRWSTTTTSTPPDIAQPDIAQQ